MTGGELASIWVYLAATPLLGLTLTLVAYRIGFGLYEKAGMHPLANPVALSVVIIVAVLLISGTPYRTYFEGAQFVHFMLGPVTVALALPLFDQWRRIRQLFLPLLFALIAGVLTAVLSVATIAWLLGAAPQTILSLMPKSVTTPVAMGIAERIGGLPSLTATMVIATGILGAMIARPLLDLAGIAGDDARGFALGVAAHGIGAARAFQVSEEMGAFAGLAMGLAALATALLVPALLGLCPMVAGALSFGP